MCGISPSYSRALWFKSKPIYCHRGFVYGFLQVPEANSSIALKLKYDFCILSDTLFIDHTTHLLYMGRAANAIIK
jgi:hypothetical protein